ncbi:MAG TPA: polysaccharide biosynthesis tyrosine autokinase [Phototrophicaceae bacterium]|nr:polysaccharide biosynthesis tyrosine autokinase [Phototrophicaceae bacterium]
MDISHLIRVLRSWLWLVLVAAFVGGGIAFILTSRQVPIYYAQTTISIGQAYQDPNPSQTQLYVGQDLVATYQHLVQTRDVLQGVIDQLKLDMTPNQLQTLISTSAISDTSLIQITVQYTDPILAADIANGVANQLIAHSPTNLTDAQQQQIDLANQQIQSLTQEITQERAQVAKIDAQLQATEDPSITQNLTSQRTVLVNQINQASATVAQFQATIATAQQQTNVVSVVDPAIIPVAPRSADAKTSTVFGVFLGAAAAIALVMALDYFDDKLRTVEVATQVLALPIVGAIPRFGKRGDSSADRLVTNYGSLSEVTEAYRRLRTNLVFMTDQDRQKVLVVTSAGPGEGKSLTTSNLAATLAFAGMRVLLIDADMRRPMLHEMFGLENNIGLSTLLFVDPENANVGSKRSRDDDMKVLRTLDQCVQATQVPNLKVITSGFIPSNPSEILGSMLMKRWIEAFRTASNIDVIIIDTPPTLMFADSSILGALVNATALLIVDSTKTRRKAAVQARDQLQQVGVDVKGIVLNRLNPHDNTSYYGGYYGGYYSKEAEPQKRGFARLLGR